MANENIVLFGCGDVGPYFKPMSAYGTLARPTLATGDLRFAQCERLYSERGALQPGASGFERGTLDDISVFSDCGFDVVSVASNHAMDWGGDALLDTVEVFQKKGIQAVG